MFNLDSLTPEEKEELKAALNGGGHPDAEQDAGMIDQSNDMIANMLQLIVERLEKLEEAVYDNLIGGIRTLYDTNKRKMGIDGLKSKYGKDLDPYSEPFKEMQGGADLYDRLYDEIENLRNAAGEGWNDEVESGEIGKMMDILKKHLIPKGMEEPKAEIEIEAGEPEGVKIEKTEVGAVGGDDMDELTEMIKRKKKGFRLPQE